MSRPRLGEAVGASDFVWQDGMGKISQSGERGSRGGVRSYMSLA